MRQEMVIRDWLPEPMANGSYVHWTKHRRKLKVAQQTTWASAKHAGWQKVPGRARLTITLVFPTQRQRDIDNLYARVKGCVDGLKDFFVDDSSEWLDLRVEALVERGVKQVRCVLEVA